MPNPPLRPRSPIKLPLGSVRPAGWLRRQLELLADGLTGRLPELSPWCRIEGSAWASPDGQGAHGWEELPYWLRGLVKLGYLLDDRRIQAKARRWIEPILASQDQNGYFGPRSNREAPDLWPNMIALQALRAYHEATGDERIVPFLGRYLRWQTTLPTERFLASSWQHWRGGDNLDSIHWLYERTGEPWLLELGRANHERTADWTNDVPTWHGVNLCQGFREPAQFFQQSGDAQHLAAAGRTYDRVMAEYGQVPGGMFAADENCRPGYVGPRQAAETCSMVEMIHSQAIMLGISGEALWADRAEEVAFNSLPAAMTPDLRALHYLTAPNMVQLDTQDKSPLLENGGDMLAYDPAGYRCCQHNVGLGWPTLAEHLWMATPDGGLAAAIYAPGSVSTTVAGGVKVRIDETTDYPFDETVSFAVITPRPARFPLRLRVPGWCASPGLALNGRLVEPSNLESGWWRIERTWADGDRLLLHLPMAVRVIRWPSHGGAASVYRGPLAFSLRIGERWRRCGPPEADWPAYEVFPTTPWNYALALDGEGGGGFEVVPGSMPADGQPFTSDSTPILLRTRGRRVENWRLEPNGLIGEVPANPVSASGRLEELTLIPMGCARLRLSVFPASSPDESGPA